MSELEELVLSVVNKVIEDRYPQIVLEQMMGTVTGVPDSNRYALVRLDGERKSVPVYRPGLPEIPREGSRVAIVRGERGVLYIDKVWDRDPDAPLLPGGTDDSEDPTSTAHTLGLHTSLGLATLEDISSHADGPGHLIQRSTPNTLDLYDGYWTKIADITVVAQFGSVASTILLGGQGSNGATWTRGMLRFRVRQQAAFGSNPSVILELLDAGDITGADIAIVVTSNAEPASTLELHVRLTREYEWLAWVPLWTRRDRCMLDWAPCSPFAATLPAGAVTTATVR